MILARLIGTMTDAVEFVLWPDAYQGLGYRAALAR
jgi:hypothetical protein